MLKAYKYRMYPNNEQEIMFNKHFGACRYVYNWGLEYKIRITKRKVNLSVVLLLTRK